MSSASVRDSSRRARFLARAGLLIAGLACGAGCSGVAPEAVRDTTSAITAQIALAKASLVSCRGGETAQCDSAQKNLEAVASANAQLGVLADQ
jgi:hypothetical protein